MIDWIAKGIANHPKVVLIVCVLLLIPSAIGYFNTHINYDILTYLPENLNSVQGEHILDGTFHNAASAIIVVENSEQKDVQKLKNKIEKVDGVSKVIWVDSIADISIPEDMLPDDIKEIFYTQDGSSTLMMVQFANGGATDATMNALKKIRTYLKENMFMSGASAIMLDTKQLADKQAPLYIVIAIVLALIALSFTLKSWVLPFVLLAALMTAVAYNMGTNIFFGQISYITQCIAAILQLGVTMDYSVFLIDRYEEERKKTSDNTDAMAKAISGTFVALAGSSLTTIFGFLALCFMSFKLGLDIGLVMAKGVVFGVLTVVTFLPSLVLVFNNAIDNTRHKSVIPHFEKMNEFTLKHRRVVTIIALVLFIPAYIFSHNVKMYYNMVNALPSDLDSVVSLNKVKTDFNMATTHFIIVSDDLPSNNMSQMTQELKNVDGITKVISLNSFVGAAIPSEVLPDEIKDVCTKDGYQIMMANTNYEAASDEENAQVTNIVNIVQKYDPNGYVTGEGAMSKDLVEVTERDFIVTNIISIAAIFILIAIIFKSVSVPFILVASIELAILINEACSFFLGTTIPFVAPTIISCVQLGATVDYAILLSTRFREELRSGKNKDEAIRVAANASDRSILQSALVFFCATFGVYVVCDISIIKCICAMLARGAVISAIIIIVVLGPVLRLTEGIINKTSLHWREEPSVVRKRNIEKLKKRKAKKAAKEA